MLKSVDENGNITYGDLSLQNNLKLNFKGKNNILFLDGKSSDLTINFSGDNSLIFLHSNNCVNIEVVHNSVCYIGHNTNFGGVSLRVYECKNIIIGNDCMFSWSIWMSTCDHHLFFNNKDNKRINFSNSIYVGDHVWICQESAILKGVFIASGSIVGARSTLGGGNKYSNCIYAGNSAKKIKDDIFWDRTDPYVLKFDDEKIKKNSYMHKEDFKYKFEKDKFLNPALIEKKLQNLKSSQEKLEFVYDYIYNNTYKNRFALFENCDISNTLYKDTSKVQFKDLKFDKKLKLGACEKIQQKLAYKLGNALIKNSKNLKLIFILYKIKKEHVQENVDLKIYNDYEKALKYKNHLSYKLGSALIKAHKNWYKLAYIKFIFDVIKIKKYHNKLLK